MIELDSVSKTFATADGEVRALDNVSLTVNDGEFVSICGHSGSGKSTLLSIVGGLAAVSSGRVVVNGQVVSEMSSAERARFRREHVGFVFQMFHLLPYLKVSDNILLASAPAQRKSIEPRVDELIEEFGLSPRRNHKPGQLSAGERQRVAMARALVHGPNLLLADEPTGNLDPKNTSGVLELVERFHQQGGTILLVTHDHDAASCAERTIELEDGKVKA